MWGLFGKEHLLSAWPLSLSSTKGFVTMIKFLVHMFEPSHSMDVSWSIFYDMKEGPSSLKILCQCSCN